MSLTLTDNQRRPIFQAIRRLRGGQGFTKAEVAIVDAGIDDALAADPAPPPVLPAFTVPGQRRLSNSGCEFIHGFESLKLTTYKDPGSKNGLPITGGWGSTLDENGKPLRLGFTAPKEYWDRLYDLERAKVEREVDRLIGPAPTTQAQFDAMVSLAYNIGIGSRNPLKKGGFTRSSVLRLHKAGAYKDASRSFILWNKNDGQVMRGLTRRRIAESELYLPPVAA